MCVEPKGGTKEVQTFLERLLLIALSERAMIINTVYICWF